MLRIIAGEFRRRLLLTPPDAERTRPIPDRVKESLFGLLRGHCEGAAVFDAFAGTGPIGLEAVSRGATRCVMIERDREVFKLLEQNVETLGVADRVELVLGDALGAGALARCPRPVTLVFMDPPYPLVREPVGWGRLKAQFEKLIPLLTEDGFAVLRTPAPLFHEFTDAGEVQIQPDDEGPRVKHRKEKGGGKQRDAARWLSEDEIVDAMGSQNLTGDIDPFAEISDDEGDAPVEQVIAVQSPVPAVTKPPEVRQELVDMKMAGAVGPETHVYHGMAVHLYMKAK